MKKIFAITVTYFPPADAFTPLLQQLFAQTSHVIIVDCTPGDANPKLQKLIDSVVGFGRCTLIRLKDNLGIAAAINVGLDHALAAGADFVLLSDQDSLPADDMVANLMRAYTTLVADGGRIAAVGPTFTDLHTRLTYPFQANVPGRFFYGHKEPTEEAPHVEALTLITSGALIPAEVVREVGPMRDDFFIDHVDIEWSHRARWKGYRLIGTGWAQMYQRMGDARMRVWYLRWRHESAYGPLRIYYRVRNFVALLKLDFIDWRWKIRNGWYCLGIIYTHAFFGEKPVSTLKMSAKGVWHGLRGRMGRYDGHS